MDAHGRNKKFFFDLYDSFILDSFFFNRLESVYRTWMHMKSTPIGADEGSEIEFRRRELSIALGTAKWQVISRSLF